MIREKRKSKRTKLTDSECIVGLGSGSAAGALLDVSNEGLRVGGLSLLVLLADQKVVVTMADETISGRCRTVTREPDGTFQIGILREPKDYIDESHSVLINSYLQFKGQKLVCIPIGFDDHTVQVRLLSGEELTVANHQVVQLVREERLEELCDKDLLSHALLTNKIKASGNDFADRSKVLAHEFGPTIKPYMPQAV
jgi:hypothetical protein